METPVSQITQPRRLHEEHRSSIIFMHEVGEQLAPLYNNWKANHGWQEVVVPEPTRIPAPWKAINPEAEGKFDDESYALLCDEVGIDLSHDAIWDLGIASITQSAPFANLHMGNDLSIAETTVHRADHALFSGKPLVYERPLAEILQEHGEFVTTNMGVGSEEDYAKLHDARMKVQIVASQIFRSTLDQLQQSNQGNTELLWRALSSPEDDPAFSRDLYNPLFHAVLEGLMSVG